MRWMGMVRRNEMDATTDALRALLIVLSEYPLSEELSEKVGDILETLEWNLTRDTHRLNAVIGEYQARHGETR